MDAIRHRAICLNLATHIESLGNGHSVVFHSTVGSHTYKHTHNDDNNLIVFICKAPFEKQNKLPYNANVDLNSWSRV